MKISIQMCGDPTVDWFRIVNEDVIVRGVYYWKKQRKILRSDSVLNPAVRPWYCSF